MILPEKRNRTIHLIRATAIPGRQRHGTEKNRSTIRKRRAIPKRESSFPVFLFFPRPSFRHSPTGTFNYSPSSALSPSADRHPGMLCKTLFHFDGAFTKPVEILGPPPASENLPEQVCPVSETYLSISFIKKRFPPRGVIAKPENIHFQEYYTRDSEDCKDSPETVLRRDFRPERQGIDVPFKKKRRWTGISDPFPKTVGILPGKLRQDSGSP